MHLIIPLFEDNHLLAVLKPAGLLTQPSGTSEDSLELFAKDWRKEVSQKKGNVFLEAVHRLDKPVSGVVLFAKTSKALSRLNASIRAKQMFKTYLAWTMGEMTEDEGVAEHFLIHDDYCAKVTSSKDPRGKAARLSYKVLERKSGCNLLEIDLETGRYHQIRCQLSALGHPVCGDIKYGSLHLCEKGAIALHHSSLSIPHPISGERLFIEAAPPIGFMEFPFQ